jgi:hypothetical protein
MRTGIRGVSSIMAALTLLTMSRSQATFADTTAPFDTRVAIYRATPQR